MNTANAKNKKETGAHYTPRGLAEFVASQILNNFNKKNKSGKLRILDPAVGDGELLDALLNKLKKRNDLNLQVFGFDTDKDALIIAESRLSNNYPNVSFFFECKNFLDLVINQYFEEDLFRISNAEPFDLIISNPPYVRTQILGTEKAKLLSRQFGLSGRVDLYHAFLKSLGIVLREDGIAGIIVSNRFMSIKSGESIRKSLLNYFSILHIWDFGDTKLFDASVLPAVLLLKKNLNSVKIENTKFTSIYTTKDKLPSVQFDNIFESLTFDGIAKINDNVVYNIKQGFLDNGNKNSGIWRISNGKIDLWLKTVEKHTYCTFRDIDKIRVGVKTTADKIFIRNNWECLNNDECPENDLLKPLITHRIANRFRCLERDEKRKILYPHINVNGKRSVINLHDYPKAANYLNRYRSILEDRKYLINSGRKWYEIWVPQDPAKWKQPKVVFWDIAEEPTFWIDFSGSVVNGDCYWLTYKKESDINLLWLAMAIGNSKFIEKFYDYKFHNKLYSGRRRFMTQYVEQFPLPNPNLNISKKIIKNSKKIYEMIFDSNVESLIKENNNLIYQAYGLRIK